MTDEPRQNSSAPDGGDAFPSYPLWKVAAAWGVHLFTATGAVFCLLAIEATSRPDWRAALLWLVVAVMVDAIDGTLARWVGVKEVLPNFDGALLDNMIDYLSFVIVPAIIVLRSELVAGSLEFPLAAGICLASAYQFCQSDAKTEDHAFKGFPSYWNIAVIYLLALGLGEVWNSAILATLIVFVFVPIKYLYPTRTVRFRALTMALTVIWAIAFIAIIWELPQPEPWLVHSSFVYVIYYLAMSLYLMATPRAWDESP